MSVNRYDIDWDQDYYSNPDGRWCFAEEAIEAIATKDAEIARLTAEVTTLRARCERLRLCVSGFVHLDQMRTCLEVDSSVLAGVCWKATYAHNRCIEHNDLKEPTDG